MSKTIAIVEDEAAIRQNYADALSRQGYTVQQYADRLTAMTAFERQLPDLALLDIGLKDDVDGGFELCRNLRARSPSLPIIFLTARDSDLDTISGLRLGADDYLTKDISLPNICARISAFFRRMEIMNQPSQQEDIVKRGPLTLDMNRYEAYWHDQRVDLTLTEFWIIHTLALRPGHVKNRDQLMSDAKIVVDDATITSHIKRIRNKFARIDTQFDRIDTVYGMGYRWIDKD
jgi:two-component system OmpR family response regulator